MQYRLKSGAKKFYPLMRTVHEDFEQFARQVRFSQPRIRLISNMTGTDEIATSAYWARHILMPVRFAKGMETLYQQHPEVLMEIGPRKQQAQQDPYPFVIRCFSDMNLTGRMIEFMHSTSAEL